MEFKREERNAQLFLKDEWREWRLASVDEVRKSMKTIKKQEILDSWDIVRLLDGWLDGPGYRYNCKNEYKPNMAHMLLVKTSVPRRRLAREINEEMFSSNYEFNEEMFSRVELSRKGMKAALLLSRDDKIVEVMCFVLKRLKERQDTLDFLTRRLNKPFNLRTNILLCAADQAFDGNNAKLVAEFLRKFEYGKEMIKAADMYGRTALHFAALHGHIDLYTFLIRKCGLKADDRDRNGENVLHFVVNSNNVDIVKMFLQMQKEMKNLIDKQDVKGRTPLHKAAANGNTQIIDILHQSLKSEAGSVKKCIGLADWSGQTALVEAARGGHLEAVERLLQMGSSPLLERTSEGKTALHYSVQIADETVASEMSRMLLEHYKSDEEKLLLLYASAKGMGTAEQIAERHVLDFLTQHKESVRESSSDLLLSAVKLGYEELAWELINRGADTHQIDNPPLSALPAAERKRVENFVKYVHTMPEGGRDQPTIHDSLGRKVFAEGLAALFLNPYVKSPVTVGISGDWGMGKSSLMWQTEMILLQAAAQLAFPNILPVEDFPGSKQYVLSPKGKRKYRMVEKGVKDLLPSSAKNVDDPLVHFLDNYQDKYPQVYKSLALMDRAEMFQLDNKQEDSSELGKIPSILTVHYNAWHYQNELEAWAGLAITITKGMEEAMTRSQRIRSRCKYAWKEHGNKILFEFLLPFLFALFISCWVTSVAWILLKKMKNPELEKYLQYGSIPVTLVLVFWTMLKQVHSVFQPVSVQIMGYVSADGHRKNLGYQHQVISDINFLKNQISEKPNWFWRFLACNWFWRMCRRSADTVKDTSVPKPSSLSKDIRIIVFVDDLDRCHDTVILQMLSAINLVLAACEINVIVGMDKKMIARAIAHKYKDHNNINGEDLAENYLSKIVQLPLALPDFSDEEIMKFLDQQLGKEESQKTDPNLPDSSQQSSATRPSVKSIHEEDKTRPLQDPETGNRGNYHPQNGTEKRSVITKLRNCLKVFSNCYLKHFLHEPPATQPSVKSIHEEDKTRPLQDPETGNRGNYHPQNGTEKRSVITKLRKCFKVSSNRPLKNSVNDQSPGAQPSVESSHEEDNTRPLQGQDKTNSKLKSTPINSKLILPTYSAQEREVIMFLSKQAPHALQIPRDWKRFLTYFRLAWNILSQLKEVKNIAGWQVQLLVWIFCCWQWKKNINLIVKKWKDLIMSTKNGAAKDEKISLKIIVEHFLDDFKDLPVETDMKGNSRTLEDDDYSMKSSSTPYRHNMDEEAAGKNSWELLQNTLDKHDVPLESILAFQKFRLQCDIGYLDPAKSSTDTATQQMSSTTQPMSSTTRYYTL